MAMDRRAFIVAAGASALVAPALRADGEAIRAIDTTPHVYDTRRPIGTPYGPEPDGVSAQQLREMAPASVVGAIVVEASPWLEDNLWLLNAVADEPFVVGVVGNLCPDDKEFSKYVERYNKHPLYLGIRHGNLWPGYDVPEQIKKPAFIEGLKLLAQADLTLDLANPRVNLLEAAVRINDAVPDLRVIVNHLGAYRPTAEEWRALEPVLREFTQRPNIYGKLSGLSSERTEDSPAQVVAANRERLDRLYEAFGEDRAIGGGYAGTLSLSIFREYLASKSSAAPRKFFWKNSARVYKWVPRSPEQPSVL